MTNTVQPKSVGTIKLIIFLSYCLLYPQLVFGNEVVETSSTFEEKFIKSNIAVSGFFDRIAESIDNFFVSSSQKNRENKSSVAIENISTSTEGQYVENVVHFIANLRLTNVENYFQLKFTTFDENEERGSKKRYGQPITRKQNYGATVGLFKKLGDVRTSFQPRIELQDPLKVSHSLSFDVSANFITYEFLPKLELFANPDKGTGAFLALNYRYFLSDIFSLNWINEGEYEEKKRQFSTIVGLSLVQEITDKSTLAYSIFTNSNNRTAYHLEAYNFSITWNHIVYNKILFYQLIPRLGFASEQSFKGAAGITVVLNLNF